MSDSILYLAIVAIWAGFLIPAWVRRPHAAKGESQFEVDEFETEIDSETDQELVADSAGDHQFDTVPRPAYQASAFAAAPTPADWDTAIPGDITDTNSEYGDDVHPHNYAQAEHDSRPAPAGPSQSREQMLRARRRMLTILVGLTFVTALFALTGLVQWWICVPPIAMLALYVMLLREIALADAELAGKRRAWEAGRAQVEAQAAAWRREQERSEPEAPERTAEIIDISSRVGDQLYDQYADATVRAVGD